LDLFCNSRNSQHFIGKCSDALSGKDGLYRQRKAEESKSKAKDRLMLSKLLSLSCGDRETEQSMQVTLVEEGTSLSCRFKLGMLAVTSFSPDFSEG
jgi:hypothetical protein